MCHFQLPRYLLKANRTLWCQRLVSFWGGWGCLCCVVTVSVLLAFHITVLGVCVCVCVNSVCIRVWLGVCY